MDELSVASFTEKESINRKYFHFKSTIEYFGGKLKVFFISHKSNMQGLSFSIVTVSSAAVTRYSEKCYSRERIY